MENFQFFELFNISKIFLMLKIFPPYSSTSNLTLNRTTLLDFEFTVPQIKWEMEKIACPLCMFVVIIVSFDFSQIERFDS